MTLSNSSSSMSSTPQVAPVNNHSILMGLFIGGFGLIMLAIIVCACTENCSCVRRTQPAAILPVRNSREERSIPLQVFPSGQAAGLEPNTVTHIESQGFLRELGLWRVQLVGENGRPMTRIVGRFELLRLRAAENVEAPDDINVYGETIRLEQNDSVETLPRYENPPDYVAESASSPPPYRSENIGGQPSRDGQPASD
ncbi:hypothetical protein EJ04DRAFT_299313 [Polyplosphaeria fusca]|uniref:Transmembrane protein n=1 Tax=Polyplosphaeria fusca TaxID=682080 RepID=A0A9P4QSC4_9PLEO|nr:hypothetical protein EJ04DRAFT_299313 [Polyplosphaeria fusca]